jgi:hypothetical protein
MLPETRYAKSGDIHIAYQVIGKGPFDLVFVPGFISHVDHVWDEPRWAGFLERLASFSRLTSEALAYRIAFWLFRPSRSGWLTCEQ